MPIAATCPECGKSYNLDDSLAGKKVRCKECRTVFALPGAQVTVTAPREAAAQPAAASAPAPAAQAPAQAPRNAPAPAAVMRSTSAPAAPPTPANAPAAPQPAPVEERSAGGIRIVREPQRPAAAAAAPAKQPPAATPYMTQIVRHIEATMGASPFVFPEMMPEAIKLDLLIVPPTGRPPSEEHPLGTNHFTVITAGLSAKPQAVPEEALEDISPLQELMIALPADWPGMNRDGTFDKKVIRDEKYWWPFAFLKMVARMPAEYETFLAPGVTIPNGEEAEPFAENTKLGCMMAFLPMLAPAAAQLQIDEKTRIDFYALWPLYPEEMQLKLDRGLDPLLKKLMDGEVSELIQIDRANLCKKKGWFGRG